VVAHGGAEIGTGTHTKVVQTVAATLGCPLEKVRATEMNSDFIPQTGWSGGSVGSEGACEAARVAALDINKRLAPIKLELWQAEDSKGKEPTWEQVVTASVSRLMLQTAVANYVPPGRGHQPWQKFWSDYFVWGASSSEVEIDVLTGEVNVLRADVLFDCGESMNPILDVGQVEGGFVFGMGCLTQEEQLIGVEDGNNSAVDIWKYKIPCVIDTPAIFNVELKKDSNYPQNIRGAKAVAEPPVVLSYAVVGAIREAIYASRSQRGLDAFTPIDAPVTVDRRAVAFDVGTRQLDL